MSDPVRTPLGTVRGLGSAKEGAHHFIAQRASAVALLFLVPWFLISLLDAIRGDYGDARAFIAQPVNAVLILLTIGAALYHMRIGMQVVIEDYIGRTATRLALLMLSTFLCILAFAAAAYAVVAVAVSA
ncbi:MAG: succinate dehydrogenase, hydrophobic membrane anchor protein [Alphaproteobacteria bacterium]